MEAQGFLPESFRYRYSKKIKEQISEKVPVAAMRMHASVMLAGEKYRSKEMVSAMRMICSKIWTAEFLDTRRRAVK